MKTRKKTLRAAPDMEPRPAEPSSATEPSGAATQSSPPYRGIDRNPERRPGVPREVPPYPLHGAHWTTPEQQPSDGMKIAPGQRDRETPVFSTALPPRGLSGAIRRMAHRIPDHRVSHWLLLLVADRIDVAQSLFLMPQRAKQRT